MADTVDTEQIEPGSLVPAGDGKHGDGKYIVAPVYKALQVLTLLLEREQVSLKEVYSTFRLSKAQAFRYLQTLCAAGFAELDGETGRYHLGLRSWELGNASTRHTKLLELATPHMERLRERFNETVNLGVPNGASVVYLGMAESRHSLRMHATIGSADPLVTTSLGKAMLAFMPEEGWARLIPETLFPKTPRTLVSHDALYADLRLTRSRGYSLDEGENELGARCVGAPLFDRQDRVVAAISLSAPEARLQGDYLDRAAEAVRETAAAISAQLRG